MAATTKKKQEAPSSNGDRKPPLHRLHYPVYNGTLSVSIFDKEISTDNGVKTVYSISIQRSYTKDNQREWTNYLRDSDVPVAILGMQDAYRYLSALRQRQWEESRNGSHQDEDIPF